MAYEDYLPRAFRRKTPLDQIPGYAGGTLGEQLGRVPNFAAPEDDIEKIWALGDPKNPVMVDQNAPPPPSNLLQPQPPPVPADFTVGGPTQISPEQLAEIGAPPMAKRGEYNRPQREFIGEGTQDERTLAYNQAVEGYKPQKAKGFWDRWLKPALVGGGIGFLAGGPGGAIGGAATNTLRSAFDPTSPNKDWRTRELAQSRGEVGGVYARRKAEDEDVSRQLGQQKTAADIGLARTRTRDIAERAKTERNVQVGTAVLDDGRTIQMERKGDTWVMSRGPDGQPIVRKPAPSSKEKVRVDVPGVGPLEVTPESALGYYGAMENRQYQRGQDAEEKTQTQAEVTAKKQALTSQAQKLFADAQIYENNASHLDPDDELEKVERQRLLNAAETARAQARGKEAEADALVVPKLNATEQEIYDAAKGKKLDPDEAVRRYRSGKY